MEKVEDIHNPCGHPVATDGVPVDIEAIENGIYHPDYIPEQLRCASAYNKGGNRRAAQIVARASQDEIRSLSLPEFSGETHPVRRREKQLAIARAVRPIEIRNLLKWATSSGNLLDASEFIERWRADGETGGSEQRIYKANDLSFHSSLLEFFHRLEMHEKLFEATAYRFEGVLACDRPVENQEMEERPETRISLVVSQPVIDGIPVDREAVGD